MIHRPLLRLALCVLLGLTSVTRALSQSPAAQPPSAVQSELSIVIEELRGALGDGRRTATALQPQLDALARLEEKYQNDAASLAEVRLVRALVMVDVLGDLEAGEKLLRQIVEAPGAGAVAGFATQRLEQIERQQAMERAQVEVIGQPAPDVRFRWASREGLENLKDLRGKVVILDFWATWCGPCIRSFPHLQELVERYKDRPVEIVGVTSVQGMVANLSAQPIDCRNEPEKEIGLLPEFAEKHGMTWTVAVSEEDVFHPGYGVRGIPHLAILGPDGTVRHNGLNPFADHERLPELIDGLLAEAEGTGSSDS